MLKHLEAYGAMATNFFFKSHNRPNEMLAPQGAKKSANCRHLILMLI